MKRFLESVCFTTGVMKWGSRTYRGSASRPANNRLSCPNQLNRRDLFIRNKEIFQNENEKRKRKRMHVDYSTWMGSKEIPKTINLLSGPKPSTKELMASALGAVARMTFAPPIAFKVLAAWNLPIEASMYSSAPNFLASSSLSFPLEMATVLYPAFLAY